MARLNFPTGPDITARVASLPPGSDTAVIDGYATAKASTEGDGTTLVLTDGPTVLTLTHTANRWDVTVIQNGASKGDGVSLPEPLLARANRAMSADGVSLSRDWRTKTHVLRAANRRTIPLAADETVSAVLTRTGWGAVPGSTPTPAIPAPSAPEPVPAPTADPTPAQPSGTTSAMPSQGIPAAYAGNIVLAKGARQKWHDARAVHKAGDPEVIAMIGPSGAGKTHAVHALAAEEGLDVVKFDASGVVEPGDWFGTVTLDGNGTRFVPSDLLLALTLPGPRVLLVDEVNRANLRALNAMLPVLDGSGTVTIPQSGKRERINRAVQVVVTANIGSAFLGTEPLDEAIRTRITTWVEVEHLGEAEERAMLLDRVEGLDALDAQNLARLGAAIRASATNGQHPPVSSRQLLAAARKMAKGADPRRAVDAAVLDGYLSEGGASSERAKVATLVAGIQWRHPKPEAAGQPGDVFTGTGMCHCGHGPMLHGIGSDVSASTHCRECARAYPGQAHRQCMTYSEVMAN